MPRAGLTPERVISAASDIADARGLDAVTLAAIAASVGVRTPSLYNHVSGLDDVRRRIAVLGLQELTAVMRDAAVGRAGEEALVGLAQAYRAYAQRRPGRYAATLRAPDESDPDLAEAARAAVDVLLAILRGSGLEGEEAIHAARAVRSALHGFVSLEAAGGFGLSVDLDESFERMVAALAQGLRERAAAATSRRSR